MLQASDLTIIVIDAALKAHHFGSHARTTTIKRKHHSHAFVIFMIRAFPGIIQVTAQSFVILYAVAQFALHRAEEAQQGVAREAEARHGAAREAEARHGAAREEEALHAPLVDGVQDGAHHCGRTCCNGEHHSEYSAPGGNPAEPAVHLLQQESKMQIQKMTMESAY